MPTTLTDALAQAREWERHHVPSVPRPRVPKEAEDRVAGGITDFAGSMRFVYLHSAWFLAWVAVNVGLLVILPAFDPFPFGLLTLIVSLEAIFLSTFVMIAQNRLAAQADARAEADYEVNVRAEAEVAKLVHLVQALLEHHADEDASERSGGRG
ncbi:MAG TPA: DUF1003 domain-containing protein [Chloroflexota bacterium]